LISYGQLTARSVLTDTANAALINNTRIVQALLHKRRSELQQQQQKRAELQQDVLAEEGKQVGSMET
jgi:hypothetical protein